VGEIGAKVIEAARSTVYSFLPNVSIQQRTSRSILNVSILQSASRSILQVSIQQSTSRERINSAKYQPRSGGRY
jgi:hypothetical protein